MAQVSAVPDDVVDLGGGVIERPVFLIGCARSGTSILGEAIAAHPRIVYLFEASAIWNELVPRRPDHRLLRADTSAETAKAVREALERAARVPQGNLLVEKNPKHVLRIPFLDAVYPDARFLHIIRDGRDTVASLMFRNRGDRWGHLEIPGWQDLLARYPHANHIRCAHQWRDSVSIARADARDLAPGRYQEIRYEALVREPARVMTEVLQFLELLTHESVDAFLPRIQDATAGSYHAKKQVRHYVENHARRVGRHAENLSAEQLRDVESVCGKLLRKLGYE